VILNYIWHTNLLLLSLRIVQSDVMWRSNEWHWCWRECVSLKHQYSLPDRMVPPLWTTQMSHHLHHSVFSLLVVMLMACYGTEAPTVQNEICLVMSHSNHFNLPAALTVCIYKIHKAKLLVSVQTQFTVDNLCTSTIHNWKPFICCQCYVQRVAMPHSLPTSLIHTKGSLYVF